MSVTTDMQNLIPKTGEVGRVRHLQERQGEVNQRQAGTKLAEQAAQQTRQVPTSPKSHGAKIERDKRGSGSGREREQGREQSKSDGEAGEDAEEKDPDRGQLVDVRV